MLFTSDWGQSTNHLVSSFLTLMISVFLRSNSSKIFITWCCFVCADRCGETLCESLKQDALVSTKLGTCSLCDSLSLVFKAGLNVYDGLQSCLLTKACLLQEVSGIIYTTVDFRAPQKPTEIYANLRMPKTEVGAAETECPEMVEYSTLAIHQWIHIKAQCQMLTTFYERNL